MTEKFHVVREHLGDKQYMPGDTREAVRTEVAHLIPQVLVPEDEAPHRKADRKPANKAEPKVQNKAEVKTENKAVS